MNKVLTIIKKPRFIAAALLTAVTLAVIFVQKPAETLEIEAGDFEATLDV